MIARFARPLTAAVVCLGVAACGGTNVPPLVAAPPTPSADPVTQAGSMTMDMGGGTTAMTAAQMDSAMAAQMKSFPVTTAGLGGQPMQPRVLADGTKEFDVTAAVGSWQVDATHTVQAWLYNGTFPGPTIHVNVGDHVRFVLTNDLPESTAVHLHGIQGIPNSMDGVPGVTQDPIEPGQTYTYSFTPTAVGVGMYHSHDDTLKQLTDGLWVPSSSVTSRSPQA